MAGKKTSNEDEDSSLGESKENKGDKEDDKEKNREDKEVNKEDAEGKKEKKVDKNELERAMNISEEYLDKVNRMKKSAERDVREGVERLEGLKEKIGELEREISAARKTGKDMFNSSALLKLAKGKIGVLENEGEEDDIDKMGGLIKEIEEQIKEDKEKKEYDLKSEIMMKAREETSKESKDNGKEDTNKETQEGA